MKKLLAAAILVASPAHATKASWYGPGFHKQKTASGEIYDQNAATCAHRTAKFGTILLVTNLANGRRAECRVNDRGPYIRGRAVDVSKAVAIKLGMLAAGVARVKVQVK